MPSGLTKLEVVNFRSLANVSCELPPLAVVFGPNGAGKSSLLDTIWFVRDCFIRGVTQASSNRGHGIGMLWDGADEDQSITIALGITEGIGTLTYELRFGVAAGRIEPYPGERLVYSSPGTDKVLIERARGARSVSLFDRDKDAMVELSLREPDKPCLAFYLDFEQSRAPKDFDEAFEQTAELAAARELDLLLHQVRFHHCRSFDLHRLKRIGSEAGPETRVAGHGRNLWSVLRNLKDRRDHDPRYQTIIDFMHRAFPGSFNDVVIEQTGATSVYARVYEHGLREPLQASGISDGYLQMLLLLTILFSEGSQRDALLILDEPEISLHPWALVVLAEALSLAAKEWNKQVLVATHSPMLISQFEPDELFAAESVEHQTRLHRVSSMDELKDLLDQYAAGSLYMAGALAAQERSPATPAAPDDKGEAQGV